MRRHGSPQDLESVRLKAIELHHQGTEAAEIAELLDRSLRWVQLTLARFRQRGEAALRLKSHPGRNPKLSARQRRGLLRRLLQGACANGFATDLWTGPRVRELISQAYGVEYHVHYVPRLLKQLGLSCQKPRRRPRQRDEVAIARWIRCDWERIKKTHVV
jgi:transposase